MGYPSIPQRRRAHADDGAAAALRRDTLRRRLRTGARWLGAVALVAIGAAAQAWGQRGHELIGAIADAQLDAHAAREVESLVGMKLQVASAWADCVKDAGPAPRGLRYVADPRRHAACKAFETTRGKARMLDYVRRNWRNCTRAGVASACHRHYHFADVAIQRDRYQRGVVGSSEHDIVSALQAAIAVLQGGVAPAPFSIRDRTEALLLLAHWVGDVHQPLHIGAVYLDRRGRVLDPDAAGTPFDPDTATRGGNSIIVGTSDLHAQWDAIAARLPSAPVDAARLAAARAIAPTAGDVSRWPAAWATETLGSARAAFDGVSFSSQDVTTGRWTARFADHDGYFERKDAVQSELLTRAGARLAQLLNAIWP